MKDFNKTETIRRQLCDFKEYLLINKLDPDEKTIDKYFGVIDKRLRILIILYCFHFYQKDMIVRSRHVRLAKSMVDSKIKEMERIKKRDYLKTYTY